MCSWLLLLLLGRANKKHYTRPPVSHSLLAVSIGCRSLLLGRTADCLVLTVHARHHNSTKNRTALSSPHRATLPTQQTIIMSTFIKSAAMSLLGKTLQTLLYKYLSDVDVEGVNLPSLLTGSDGHSGWGVRLANVRLREGAKLFDLPGTPRRTKAKKKSIKCADRWRRGRRKNCGTSNANRTNVQSSGLRSNTGAKASHPANVPATGGIPPPSSATAPTTDAASLDDADTVATTQSTASASASTVPSSLATVATGQAPPESGLERRTSSSSSRWFSSWYSSSSSAKPAPPDPPALNESTTNDNGKGNDNLNKNYESDNPSSPADPLVGKLPQDDEKYEFDDDDHGDDHQEEEADETDVDCSETDDDLGPSGPMVLRLCGSSRIGILDVRLVGKELHVHVEDAHLCVEAVRLQPPSASSEVGGGGKVADGADAASNAAVGSGAPHTDPLKRGTTPAAPPSGPGPRGAPHTPPATPGERVLAENALARALAAIPNLFLRDIRIQLFLRDGTVDAAAAESTTAATTTNGKTAPAEQPHWGDRDALVDVSIELLSVTDGEDFLSKFGAAATRGAFAAPGDDDAYDEEDGDDADYPGGGARASDYSDPYDDPNDFLVKRVRTGRGPEGGICVRVYPPCEAAASRSPWSAPGDGAPPPGLSPVGPLWALSTWHSLTEFCLLRCSGLDVQARIFLGSRDDEYDDGDGGRAGAWFAGGDDYADYDVDSMLFGGVDYIVPGPRPPLPPMSVTPDAGLGGEVDKFWTHEGATVYRTDGNGIQSSAVSSSYHRTARGLIPTVCQLDHLPCEECAQCWKARRQGAVSTHALDRSTPMAGLVLSILTRDPLNINVDRASLTVLGDLVQLFRKKDLPSTDAPENVGSERGFVNPHDSFVDDLGAFSDRSRRSYQSRNSQGSRTGLSVPASLAQVDVPEDSEHTSQGPEEEDLSASYPSYMQPEKVQLLGVHLADVVLRMHVMRDDGVRDEGLSFCFWDVASKCITIDQQTLARTHEKSLQDLRLDVGYLTLKEYKGTESNLLLSLGLRQRVVEFDDMTIETMKTREELSDRSPWPSTAAALLEVQPPLETLVYEERDRHALQFRYVVVGVPDEDPDRRWTHVNVRFGPSSVDAPFTIKDQVPMVYSGAQACVFGQPDAGAKPEEAVNTASSPSIKAIMKYKVQLDGGRVRLHPRIDMKVPLTVLVGERSSELGLSFQTALDRVNFSYGERYPEPRALECGGLSLAQLAELSESVRLRILLFLPSLDALERALYIKPEANSFLRCRSVNKAILKMAKRVGRRARLSTRTLSNDPNKLMNRRQELMAELLKMDDDTLEDLVMVHRRYQRKASQRS